MASLLYPPLKLMGRVMLKMFFRKLASIGEENIPRTGPVVVVANHPNMLLDPMVMGVTCPRAVHFLAKSTLFHGLMGLFLRQGGVLPVYRRQDNDPRGQNEATFSACFEILEAGGVIGLFPEGISHSELRMLGFKTGAARIALDSATRCTEPVSILPCGIWYTHKTRWWSDCLVVYGQPIEVPPTAQGAEDRNAVIALTQTAEDSLRELLVELDDQRQGRAFKLVEGLYRHRLDGADLEERWEFAQTVIRGYQVFGEEDPERVAGLMAELEEYGRLLEHLGLRPNAVVWEEMGRLRALGRLCTNLIGLLLYLVPAFAGILLNYIPYKIPGLFGSRARDVEGIATTKILVGLVCFLLWYAALSVTAFWLVGWPGALVGPACPFLGRFAIRYLRQLRRFVRGVRFYAKLTMGSQLTKQLAARQNRLIEELDALGQELQAAEVSTADA